LTWYNRSFVDCSFTHIEPQIGGSFVDIGSMASEAVLAQDRSDIAIVLDHSAREDKGAMTREQI
jgi:hypothetical protein